MEIKKTPRADLEKDKSLSFLMGLAMALAILFVGFEWGEKDLQVATDSGLTALIDEEEIEMTIQNEPPPPPPPEPEVIKEPDILEIVEDEEEVESIQIASSEDDASQAQVETYVAPVEEEEEEVDENFIFVTVEKMPEFPGGTLALLKWISDNINYPPIAAENGISGRVYCTFTVNADGSVSDVEVARPVDPNLDKEALRVLKKLPKFQPGEQRGKPVRVKYSVPVRFQLKQ
ncbi:MAG TPA: energy transducer TonB [Porphyromonadaceae bacterium]|nr:energy transducer TonB [Porphyromonadaceae bacterium]